MSLKWIIPKDEMDQLTCFSCNNYLSIFPVYVKNDNSIIICGRCTPMNKDDFIRDDAFEAIAEFMLFPCSYKQNGCEEELTPSNLKQHEVICVFRKFECPSKFFTRCEWLGLQNETLKHFEENHPDLLLKNSQFDWKFGTSYKGNFLLPFEKELFVVNKEVDARKEYFFCSVQRFGAKSNDVRYNYKIKLLSDDLTYWHAIPQMDIDNKEPIIVIFDYVKEKLNNPSYVIVQIEIVSANDDQSSGFSTKSSENEKNPDLNWNLLGELQCPVCDDHMLPPIYQCKGGHSICSQCKLINITCSLCKTDILEKRNFSLENVSQLLNYPCKYHKSGCKYTSKSTEIMTHQNICPYGPYQCPMAVSGKCHEEMNRSQIVPHMEDKHPRFIQRTNRVKVNFEMYRSKQYFYFVRWFGTIFIVRYKYEYPNFYWAVQMVGSVEESKKFKFDIDVVDNSKNNLKFYVKGCCTSIREVVDFQDPLKYVMLTYQQLRHLITTTFDYHINILVDDLQKKN